MTIELKSQQPYWTAFASYQSFNSVEEMIEQVKLFEKTYSLTPAIKAVLNTLKLHAKRYFAGVCWLKREEIAKKAKVSLASVKRAIKELKEVGILSVYPHIHTKKGGKAHNVYVIEPLFAVEQGESAVPSGTRTSNKPENEPSPEDVPTPSETVVTRVSDDSAQSYKNPNTNPDKTSLKISIGKIDILKNVPNEFVDLMEPFYANNPEVIHARWKTVLSAIKNSKVSLSYVSFDTIGQAWTDVVKFYKRGKIKNCTDDGLGAYFYGVLCDYFLDDFLRNAVTINWS